MQELLEILIAVRDTFNHHIVFAVGILLVMGYFLGQLAEKLKLPAITGYIVAGLLLGDSVTGIIHVEMSEILRTITDIALGIIAITIGGEFSRSKLGRLGRGIVIITAVQLLAAFLVTAGSLAAFGMPVPYALILGAVASATAPAATVVIIQKLRARGDFVDTLYGVVALDDAGCVILFSAVFAIAGNFIAPGAAHIGILSSIGSGLSEIGLSLLVGLFGGGTLHLLLLRKKGTSEILIISLGSIFLITAISVSLHLSPLLSNMAAGALLVNLSSRNQRIFRSLQPLTPPLYAAFFAVAGTELKLSVFGSREVLMLGGVFVLARFIGKYGGVWLGAKMAGCPAGIRKYMGLSMIPQAGVAIGLVLFLRTTPLAVSATPEVTFFLDQMINIVLFAVLVNELAGPPLSREAILRGTRLKDIRR